MFGRNTLPLLSPSPPLFRQNDAIGSAGNSAMKPSRLSLSRRRQEKQQQRKQQANHQREQPQEQILHLGQTMKIEPLQAMGAGATNEKDFAANPLNEGQMMEPLSHPSFSRKHNMGCKNGRDSNTSSCCSDDGAPFESPTKNDSSNGYNDSAMPLCSLPLHHSDPQHARDQQSASPQKHHWQHGEPQAEHPEVLRNEVQFALPPFDSSSSSSSSEEGSEDDDSDDNERHDYEEADHDEDGEDHSTFSTHLRNFQPTNTQHDECWNQHSQLFAIESTAKRKRLRKLGGADTDATANQSAFDESDDEIFTGKGKRVSLSATKANNKRSASFRDFNDHHFEHYHQQHNDDDDGEDDDDLPPGSGLKTFPSTYQHRNDFAANATFECARTKATPVFPIQVDSDSEENQQMGRYSSNFMEQPPTYPQYEGLRKAFHESPSLASRWAIATSAKKAADSRRVSTSPFLEDWPRTDNNTELAASNREMIRTEDESPSVRVLELDDDQIDEFSDDETSRRLFPSHAKSKPSPSSNVGLSRRRALQSKPSQGPLRSSKATSSSLLSKATPFAKVHGGAVVPIKDNSANPFGLSGSRQPSVTSHARSREKSGEKLKTSLSLIGKDSFEGGVHDHRLPETLPRPWSSTSSRLRATTQRSRSKRSSSSSSKAPSKSASGTTPRIDVIDMTEDYDQTPFDGVGYKIASVAPAAGRISSFRNPDANALTFYRNDLFGGSGCGTEGVKVLEQAPEHSSTDEESVTERKKTKKKRPSITSKRAAASKKNSTKSSKGRKKNTSNAKKRNGGPKRKGGWGKGKNFRMKSKTESSRSVWSSRESGVGSYSRGKSSIDISDVGLADVGGASITF